MFYCDNCGQNKNKYEVSMLMYCVMTLNIPSIAIKFLTVGHTAYSKRRIFNARKNRKRGSNNTKEWSYL